MSRSVTIDVDAQWFVSIPDGTNLWAWAAELTSALPIAEGRTQKSARQALIDFAESADPEAFATLLYCPDGLPGRAFVSIYVQACEFESLDELVEAAPATLPRQVIPLGAHEPTRGRVISTLTDVADVGHVGSLQFQLLRDGALVEVVVTSPNLTYLGLGIPTFEALVESVVVANEEGDVGVAAE